MNRTEREQAWDKEFNEEWNEIWRPLVTTDGCLDVIKIKNELQDLVFIYKQVAEVYCYITGNQLSKAMYYAQDVITAYEDDLNGIIKEDRLRVVKLINKLIYTYRDNADRELKLCNSEIDDLIDEIMED
jgi:hypothetical protein